MSATLPLYFPYGEPLVTRGMVNIQAMCDIGLLTNGFVWLLDYIYIDAQKASGVTTAWSLAAGSSITTTWAAAAGSSIVTTWTNVQFGIYGEYTP